MSDYRTVLHYRLGSNISTEQDICQSYNHDLGEMPGLLLGLFRRTPEAVVLPRSAEDVQTALRIAREHDVPVTPRGQASSGYGGAMPTRGGLVIDLACMNRILAVDEDALTVDVEPGIVWNALSEALAAHGMDNRLCPTSGPSSTVGGWFCMGGVGIGSMMYGSIADVVTEIDVVEPGGALKTVSGAADLGLYCGSGGCVGVVTRLRLLCRKAEPLRHVAVSIPDAQGLGLFMLGVRELHPYSASVLSAEYLRMQAEAEGRPAPEGKGFLVTLAFFASDCDWEAVALLAERFCGTLLDEAVAEHEWESRFHPMRIKRGGPSLLVGECTISCFEFHRLWGRIRRLLWRDRMGLEAFGIRDGRLAVLVYLPDSARGFLSLFRMGKAMIPLHAAKALGGAVYSPGLWFNAQAKDVLGASRLCRLRKLKREVDPGNRMNPGKVCGSGLGFLPFALLSRLIWIGTLLSAPLSMVLSTRPRLMPRKEDR